MAEAALALVLQQALSNAEPCTTIPGVTHGYLKIGQVEALTGLKKSSIFKMIQEGLFPAGYKLSSRATGWRSDEIMEWIDSRPKANETQEAAA